MLAYIPPPPLEIPFFVTFKHDVGGREAKIYAHCHRQVMPPDLTTPGDSYHNTSSLSSPELLVLTRTRRYLLGEPSAK